MGAAAVGGQSDGKKDGYFICGVSQLSIYFAATLINI